MVGFEGRENVRSTLGFLDSTHRLGATIRKGSQMSGTKGKKCFKVPLKDSSSLLFPDFVLLTTIQKHTG